MRPLAALLLAGGVLLAGCSDDGDGAATTKGSSQDQAGDKKDSGKADDGDEVTVAPTGPPTKPSKIPAKHGERSASGGTDIQVQGDRVAFATPSGNMVCTLNERTAACQVLDGVAPQAGHLIDNLIGPCTADQADTIMLNEGRGAWTCLDESLVRQATTAQGGWWIKQVDNGVTTKIDKSSVAVLPYGSTITVGSVSCSSAEDGVRCQSGDLGKNFFVSRTAYNYG